MDLLGKNLMERSSTIFYISVMIIPATGHQKCGFYQPRSFFRSRV